MTQPTAEGLQEEVGRVTHDAESLPMPVVLDFPALRQDEMYEIVIRACIRIACRNTTEFNKNLSVGEYVVLSMYVYVRLLLE